MSTHTTRDRMNAAMAYWQATNPDSFFATIHSDERTGDVFIEHAPDGNHNRYSIEALRRYGQLVTTRIDVEDIDAWLTPQTGRRPSDDELRERIADELGALADEVKAARTHLTIDVAVRRRTDRIMEIVTLGMVTE